MTEAEIEALASRVDTSIEELQEALFVLLAGRMPGGMELDSVEFKSVNRLEGHCADLETVRDMRDLADALGSEVQWTTSGAGDTPMLTVWAEIGSVKVRFVLSISEEQLQEFWGR